MEPIIQWNFTYYPIDWHPKCFGDHIIRERGDKFKKIHISLTHAFLYIVDRWRRVQGINLTYITILTACQFGVIGFHAYCNWLPMQESILVPFKLTISIRWLLARFTPKDMFLIDIGIFWEFFLSLMYQNLILNKRFDKNFSAHNNS